MQTKQKRKTKQKQYVTFFHSFFASSALNLWWLKIELNCWSNVDVIMVKLSKWLGIFSITPLTACNNLNRLTVTHQIPCSFWDFWNVIQHSTSNEIRIEVLYVLIAQPCVVKGNSFLDNIYLRFTCWPRWTLADFFQFMGT